MKYISHQLILVALSIFCSFSLAAQCIPDTEITTEGNGTNEVLTCPGDGRSDLVIFQSNTGDATGSYAFIITNENNIILDYRQNPFVDFDRTRFSPFRVYGLSFSGDLMIRRGAKLFSSTLATGCFELSKNYVTIKKSIPDAKEVSTVQGRNDLIFCPGDASNQVQFQTTATEEAQYAYAAVDNEGTILSITSASVLNFASFETGDYEVYGIAYRGSLVDARGDNIFDDYLASDCFSISENTVKIAIEELSGGTISTDVEAAIIDACSLNGALNLNVRGQSGSEYAYLVANEEDIIVSILPLGQSLDISTLQAGNYRISGLAYTRSLTIQVGDNINAGSFSKGCYELSENTLRLQKTALSLSNITAFNQQTSVDFCEQSNFSFDYQVAESATAAYVLTNDNDKVLAISSQAEIETDSNFVSGRVYGIAYTGNLNLEVGDDLNASLISTACFERSDNFVRLQKVAPEAGDLRLLSGGTRFYACPEEAGNLMLQAQAENQNSNLYSYLLLDQAEKVVAISTNGDFRFTEEATGRFSVLGVGHLLPLNIAIGDAFSSDYNLSTECYDLSDNRVEVVWQEPSGGRISTLSGEETVFICPSSPDTRVDLKNEAASGEQYIYILTDKEKNILAYSIRGFDLSAYEGVEFFVYGLSFSGNYREEIGVQIGEAVLSNSCHALTESPLAIKAFEAQETLVATEDLAPSIDVCVGSNESVELSVMNTGTQAAYLYILTDESDRVLKVFEEANLRLSDNLNGERRIWGVSASGSVTIKKGEDVKSTPITDGCFQLSANYVQVNATQLSNTKITTFQDQERLSICSGDGASDYIGFYTLEETTNNYSYIITDANNTVLRVLRGNIQNFEGAGPSVSRIWGVNYKGNLRVRPGQNINDVDLSDDCYALSENFVEITRARLDAGVISIVNNEEDDLKLCTAFGASQLYELENSSTGNSKYTYVITDANGIVLKTSANSDIDFGAFAQDELKIYGISHVGELSLQIGDDINASEISSSCYDMAANQLTVLRDVVDAGEISTPTGETAVYLCPNNSEAAMVVFTSNSTSRQDYQFVITDEDNVILALPNSNLYDFSRLGAGEFRVWGVSYTGAIRFDLGGVITNEAALSTECYSLSKDYMIVGLTNPFAGQLTTIDGKTSQVTYVGNGTPDLVEFELSEGSGNLLLVITNTTNTVVGLSTTGSFDFDPLTIGFYRAYGVAYSGEILLEVGDVYNANGNLVEGCFDASRNFVQIICAPGNRGNRPVPGTTETASIYPNPAINDITLNFEQNSTLPNSQIRIYNALGQEVYRQTVASFKGYNQVQLDVSGLQAAWYILEIENGATIQTLPLLKKN
ncbi:MAG: T9SS type A sorting domain-containing protein [Bacteroidota bacterium]